MTKRQKMYVSLAEKPDAVKPATAFATFMPFFNLNCFSTYCLFIFYIIWYIYILLICYTFVIFKLLYF